MPLFYLKRRNNLINRLVKHADCDCKKCQRIYTKVNRALKKLDDPRGLYAQPDYYRSIVNNPCMYASPRPIRYSRDRDTLFKYIGEVYACRCSRCQYIAEEGMKRFAKLSGTKFGSRYYYLNTVDGIQMRDGLSAAIHDGGIEAANTYLSLGARR